MGRLGLRARRKALEAISAHRGPLPKQRRPAVLRNPAPTRDCEDCGEPSPKDERRLRCPWCKKLVCPWCRHHVHNGEHLRVKVKK